MEDEEIIIIDSNNQVIETSNIVSFTSFTMPAVKRIHPEFIKIEPLPLPKGLLFYFDKVTEDVKE